MNERLAQFDNLIAVSATDVNGRPSLTSMLKSIDKDDLKAQTILFQNILRHDTDVGVSQLRHRADMMRRRADELDELADKVEKSSDITIERTQHMVEVHDEIVTLLAKYAHIEPTKITNEER